MAEVSKKFQTLENTSKHNQFHGAATQTAFKIHHKIEKQLQIVLNDPLDKFWSSGKDKVTFTRSQRMEKGKRASLLNRIKC